MHKVTKVRQELVSANNKIKSLENQVSCPELPNVRSELARVKKESDHKSQLLDKIKNLLQRAAVKEKALIEEVRLILIFLFRYCLEIYTSFKNFQNACQSCFLKILNK